MFVKTTLVAKCVSHMFPLILRPHVACGQDGASITKITFKCCTTIILTSLLYCTRPETSDAITPTSIKRTEIQSPLGCELMTFSALE